MKKGIFWCANFDTEFPELITVSVVCDKNGNSKEPVQFSSKSGNNFNHRLEWECIVSKVIDEFGLKATELTDVRIKSDGSHHYHFTCASI